MITFTTLTILLVMMLVLLRALRGPRLYDRILAINTFGTATVLLILLLGFVKGEPQYTVDIALLYALLNFISTLAVLKFFRFRQHDRGPSTEEPFE